LEGDLLAVAPEDDVETEAGKVGRAASTRSGAVAMESLTKG
jgi:hypothetical protein